MHKRANQLQDHQKRSKRIIIFFLLDILLLILSLLAALIQTEYSRAIIVIGLTLDLYFMILTIVYAVKNLVLVSHLEEYFFNKNYGTSSSRIQQFHKLIDNNLFRYHFQPIINAKTGEIFAYEALMRTDTDLINMLPLEILDLASKEGCLYDIEKHTFFNVLKLMREYEDIFQVKKLFINSIPSHQLSEEDFHILCSEYNAILPNVVIEITEATNISETTLLLIQKRLKDTGCQLGLDEFGTGYASIDNLDKMKPSYIKIDRSIIKYLNADSKKQNLVTELVRAAQSNNVKTIAVGIESYEELEYVIGLDIDYIQGFFTCKPDQLLDCSIQDDIIQKIQQIYYQKYCESSAKKTYETNGERELLLSDISPDQFYTVVVHEAELTIKGNPDNISDIAIIIPDNHKCNLILDNVSLRNNERPSILLNNKSSVRINLVGNNQLLCDGIRVYETADLTIEGDGSLTILADRTGRVGIGGSDSQSYGNITLAHTGNVKVKSNGNISIGIGGGQNPANSSIRLLSGHVQIESIGYNSIGIGSVLGSSNIEIGPDCSLTARAEATKAVCLGSLVGKVDIKSSGQLDVRCDSRVSAVIGVIDGGEGSITIKDGFSNIRFNSQTGIGIGAVNGNISLNYEGGDYLVYGEGRELLGIGDHAGNSRIRISGGVLAIQLFTSTSIMTGNISQRIIIDSGNIQCDFPEETILVNSYGTPLISHIITNSDEFQHVIETVSYSYEYKASYSARYPFIKVYLPENASVS